MPPQKLVAHLEHFRWRILQDAILEATADYWLRRAETFEAARPRPGDYLGQATPADHQEHDRRLAAAGLACRNHAWLVRQTGLDGETRHAIGRALAEVESIDGAA